jgi:predicted nucleic acid-binding protein
MELRSTLKKFGYAEQQVVYRIDQMQAAFPEAIVDGYRGLIDAMKNDAKDRHVLAAAIKCGADCIVSSNKKHFPESALSRLNSNASVRMSSLCVNITETPTCS